MIIKWKKGIKLKVIDSIVGIVIFKYIAFYERLIFLLPTAINQNISKTIVESVVLCLKILLLKWT